MGNIGLGNVKLGECVFLGEYKVGGMWDWRNIEFGEYRVGECEDWRMWDWGNIGFGEYRPG